MPVEFREINSFEDFMKAIKEIIGEDDEEYAPPDLDKLRSELPPELLKAVESAEGLAKAASNDMIRGIMKLGVSKDKIKEHQREVSELINHIAMAGFNFFVLWALVINVKSDRLTYEWDKNVFKEALDLQSRIIELDPRLSDNLKRQGISGMLTSIASFGNKLGLPTLGRDANYLFREMKERYALIQAKYPDYLVPMDETLFTDPKDDAQMDTLNRMDDEAIAVLHAQFDKEKEEVQRKRHPDVE